MYGNYAPYKKHHKKLTTLEICKFFHIKICILKAKKGDLSSTYILGILYISKIPEIMLQQIFQKKNI